MCVCVCVLCAYVFVNTCIADFFTSAVTVLRLTPSAAAVRSLGFSKHIFKFPLSFSLSKIAYIDYYLLQVR